MLTIRLNEVDCLSDEYTSSLAGVLLGGSEYDTLIDDDATVYKPDGTPLLIYRTNVLSSKATKLAYKNLRDAAVVTDNRGNAGGLLEQVNDNVLENTGTKTRVLYRNVKKDGTLSKQARANPIHSGIVGYFDRNSRFPYCRTTAYNLHKGHRFQSALPFIQEINSVFKREHPERYANQESVIKQTSQDFYIKDTVFTTVTVNKNWQTAVHQDKGDYADGFGVLTAIRSGHYQGGYFCFPKYKVAVDIRTRSVLLADVHEWHGNTPIIGVKNSFERISFVLYYRDGMAKCGTAAEELERAKELRS